MTTSGDWTQIFGILFFGNFIFWGDYLSVLGYKPAILPQPETINRLSKPEKNKNKSYP